MIKDYLNDMFWLSVSTRLNHSIDDCKRILPKMCKRVDDGLQHQSDFSPLVWDVIQLYKRNFNILSL